MKIFIYSVLAFLIVFWSIVFGYNIPLKAIPIDSKVLFNPSGTHLKNGQLKIRYDIYLSEKYMSYNKHIYYDKILNEIIIGEALSIFINIDENTTKEEIENYLLKILTLDDIATIDYCLNQKNSAHYISSFMKNKTKYKNSNIKSNSLDVINNTNNKFNNSNLTFYLSNNNSENVIPYSIDVGILCSSGATTSAGYTFFNKTNPANENGVLDVIQVGGGSLNTGVDTKVGTGYNSISNDYTCRDSEIIGIVHAGAIRTFYGLSIEIEENDLIGIYFSSGTIDADYTGASGGRVYYFGDSLNPFETQTYVNQNTRANSLYGTGIESFIPQIILW